MCFIVRENQTKVQIADKDIVCWKEMEVGKNAYHSFYRGFVYEKGKLYKRNCLNKDIYLPLHTLTRGFHSYIVKEYIPRSTSIYFPTIIVKFIIPKGARYLINRNHNEHISNQIIMP